MPLKLSYIKKLCKKKPIELQKAHILFYLWSYIFRFRKVAVFLAKGMSEQVN